ERVKNLAEAIPMIAYLFSGSTAELDDVSIDKCLRLEGIGDALQAVIASLEDPELPWQAARIETALRQLPERLGLKPKLLFQAVRVAICGNMVSPPLFESLELIGRTNSLERLRTAWLITL
ncbi:MAG: glutamate--tRNA ligase, partial [Actinomycetia bacterium]|nr:glutamate--tRNA ligase [Actinomycetes bacterium]